MKLIAVLLLAVLGVVKGSIFPLQYEIEYSYEAIVQATVQKPSVYTSEYLINAKIYATGLTNGVLVRLANVTQTTYSGKADQSKKSNMLPIKPEAESIIKPFLIQYDKNGKTVEVLTDVDDKLWSVNMKKALASLLQVDLKHLDSDKVKPYGFYSTEQTVYGSCYVLYTVNPKTHKNHLITKHHTASTCNNFEWNFNTDSISNSCENHREEPIAHSSERYYDVELENKEIVINHVEGFNRILFNPFNSISDTHSILINQTLHKLSGKKLPDPVNVDKLNMQRYELKTDFLKKDQNQNNVYDVTGGRQIINQELAIYKMRMALANVFNYFKTSHTFLTDKTDEQNVNYLLRQLRNANENVLTYFYLFISKVKTEDDKEILNIFFKLLPQAGTYASTILIRDLVIHHNVEDNIAIKMLQDIPYYIRHPDKTILDQLYDLTLDSTDISDELKETAVIMFASMITKVMRYNDSNNDRELETYIDYYIETLKETDNYHKRVLYLHALKNIDHGKVMKYLELVVRNSTEAMLHSTSHLRVLAMWSALHGHLKHPMRIENIYWPILSNQKENFEVRATALQIIISSATMNDHMKLYWFMNSETDTEFYNTYYTMLKSISTTTVTCYRSNSNNAKKILEFAKEPVGSHNSSMNHLHFADFFNPNFGLGLTNRATKIGNLFTHNFVSFFTQWSPQVSSMMFNQLTYYVNVQISTPFKNTLSTTSSIEHIGNLLTSQTANDVNIEVVSLKYDQVISVTQYNLTSVHDLWKNRDDVMKDYHQTVSYKIEQIINKEVLIPTDIGVPVSLYIQMPTVKKTKFLFESGLSQDTKIITSKARYDSIWWYRQIYGISVYNPIADLWHGSQKVQVLKAHVPFNVDVSFNLQQGSSKVSLGHKLQENLTDSGFQSHVHSQVYMYNDNSNLDRRHPKCHPVTVVTKGKEHRTQKIIWEADNKDTGSTYQYALFDCERRVSSNSLDYWRNIFTNDENNSWVDYPFLKTLKAVEQWHEFIAHSPDSGMCSVGFLYTPSSMHSKSHSNNSTQDQVEPVNECEIGFEYIVNVDKSRQIYQIPCDWMRLAGDCNAMCKWEISLKKSNDKLIIRIKFHDDVLEIRSNEAYQIMLNGKTLPHLETGYYNGSWFNYKVLKRDHQLVLHVNSLDIHINYTGNVIKLQLPNKQYEGFCYEVSNSTI